MLAAKSISTGCAPTMGNPTLLYSQARFEQDGCDHTFRSADEQRGQRRRFFQCAGSVFATERSTAESCKEGPHMSFLLPLPAPRSRCYFECSGSATMRGPGT